MSAYVCGHAPLHLEHMEDEDGNEMRYDCDPRCADDPLMGRNLTQMPVPGLDDLTPADVEREIRGAHLQGARAGAEMMLIWQSIGMGRLVQHRLPIRGIGETTETCCGLPVYEAATPETARSGDLWHADHQADPRMVIHCNLCQQAGCK